MLTLIRCHSCCHVLCCAALTLEPLYEYINNRMILTGYRATNSIIFRVDIPMAGAIIDSIVERGTS
jgi:uncharacterized protein YggE